MRSVLEAALTAAFILLSLSLAYAVSEIIDPVGKAAAVVKNCLVREGVCILHLRGACLKCLGGRVLYCALGQCVDVTPQKNVLCSLREFCTCVVVYSNATHALILQCR